jgi:hypothetical protein
MKKLTRREIVEANILYAKLDTPEERRQLADFHMGRTTPNKLGRGVRLFSRSWYIQQTVDVARRAVAAGCTHEEAIVVVRFFWERSRAFAIRESRHLSERAPRSFQCQPFKAIEETVRQELRRSQQPRKKAQHKVGKAD